MSDQINKSKQAWAERVSLIEQQLEQLLPTSTTRHWIETVGGSGLDALTPSQADIFNAPAKALVSRGGKRWRPVLMLLSSELAGNKKAALPLTPVVELPHNGSLIIDDIEDSSDLRRGNPAAHIEFGADIAINAGNLIYFLPTVLIENSNLAIEIKAKLYEIYSRCMRRLHFGQGMDIQWHREATLIPEVKSYLTMCRLKTGSLSRMAAEMGHCAAGGNQQKGDQLAAIAEDIGVGFQIADDITNLRAGNPGKKRGDDIVEMKKSLPVILFAENNNPEKLIILMKQASQLGIDAGNSAVEEAIALLKTSGAIQKAAEMAEDIMQQASKMLAESFLECEASNLIQFMIQSFKIP